jgi:16S rRNA (cytosine967-C5)-methyltransferase
MRFQSYFNTAATLIKAYDGSVPLVHFLKQYFAQHKKHGSKDRKFITHLCYCYYRLGHALNNLPVEERLKIALFVCNDEAGEWRILFEDSWKEHWSNSLQERIQFITTVYTDFSVADIFPWKDELSEMIDDTAFAGSHCIQPDLFLRIRPNKEKLVLQKLNEANIPFQQLSSSCLALNNASKVDAVLQIDNEVVVQDYSSQRIQEFLQLITYDSSLITYLWDCCAASGGKSILAKDVLQNINVTVSDIRSSILQNLKERFRRAGIKDYHSFVADVSMADGKNKTETSNRKFDIILCDAPCSGSGTWGRTPEQLYFFKQEKVNEYASLQKKIISNTISHLNNNRYFLYITCSVFEKENEENVRFIQQQFNMSLIKQEVLAGYDKKADSMFAALFKKG